MFMFRSRRTALARRLWRARARRDSDPPAAASAAPVPGGNDAAAATLLRRLRAPQLEALLAAVESRGADATACVLLPRGPPPPPEPHLLCCQTWRWPDLCSPAELKQLPACSAAAAASDPGLVCVNPYHWSRLCRPETPPPPYCRVESSVMTASTPLADQPTEVGSTASSTVPCSLATGGGGSGDVASRAWCRVAYWELAMRVGRLFAVETPAVDVFGLAPRGDGLCLTTLADGGGGAGGGGSGTTCAGAVSAGGGAATLSCSGASEAVRRTRAKIGQGLTLSCEVDGVWAYNRSEGPIFVNSPTLDDPDARTLLVYRVPPGHCLNIFEHAKAEEARRRRRQWDQLTQSGPTDPNSVRISFAKGWGPKYSRQEVTACPCWLEVLLAPCR